MKPYQSVQNIFAVVGLNYIQSKSKKALVMAWLIVSLGTSSSATFLIFEAETFEEYTTSTYLSSGGFVLTTMFTIMIFKMEEIFKFADSIEIIIDDSKSWLWTFLVAFSEHFHS